MNNLINIKGMMKQLTKSVIENKVPFLGICVGMQLLANISFENGQHKGLGWIPGEIKKLPTSSFLPVEKITKPVSEKGNKTPSVTPILIRKILLIKR